MSLAQGNNTPTRPRIEPGSPDPESDALTTRPVRSPYSAGTLSVYGIIRLLSRRNKFDKILELMFHTLQQCNDASK